MIPPTAPAALPNPLYRLAVALLAIAFVLWPVLIDSRTRDGDALGHELVGDGLGLVTQHETLLAVQQDPSRLLETLRTSWWGAVLPEQKLYRPVATFTLGLAGAVAGPYDEERPGSTPFPYHLITLALHLLCALLVFDLVMALFANERMALVAGALFATIPVHGEVLFDPAGVAELLCTAFSLAAWIAWVRAGGRPLQLALCALFVLLATLSKESAFALPLVFVLADAGRANAKSFAAGLRTAISSCWPALAALAVVLAISLALRWSMLGELRPAYNAQNVLDNPLLAADVGALQRVMNAARLLAGSVPVILGFNPFSANHLFSADYSLRQVEALPAFAGPNLLGLALLLLMLAGAVALYTRCALRAGLVWAFLASLLVTSNLLFPIGTVFAERLLYFPSAILVAFLAAFLVRLGKPGLVLGLALALAAGTWLHLRAPVWKSNRELWKYTAKYSAPLSARAQLQDGVTLAKDRIFSMAANSFERATELAPDYALAQAYLGNALWSDYRPMEAEAPLLRAFELMAEAGGWTYVPEASTRPLGQRDLLYRLTQLRVFAPEAKQALEHLAWLEGLEAKGYLSPAALQYKAETLAHLNRAEEAEAAFRKSLDLAVTPETLRSFGYFLRLRNRDQEALELYSRYTEDPNAKGALGAARAELLLARGDAELMSSPAAALRTADEVLTFELQLDERQRFRARVLKAQAMLDLFPKDPTANRARLEEIEHDYKVALTTYREGNEETYLARLSLSHVLFQLGKDDEAARMIREGLQFREAPTQRYMLGLILERSGKADEALAECQAIDKVLSLHPTSSAVQLQDEVRRAILRQLEKLARQEQARAQLQTWIASVPVEASAAPRLLESLWLFAHGEGPAALSAARSLREAFATRADFVELERQLARAMELESLRQTRNATGPQLRELSLLCLSLGDETRSGAIAKEASALASNDDQRAEWLLVACDAAERQQDFASARSLLEQTLTMAQSDGIRAYLQKRLDLLPQLVPLGN